MAVDDVAAIAADDDFDVSADLAAAFDAAEQEAAPAADVPAAQPAEEKADRARDEKGRFAKADEPAPESEAKLAPVAAKAAEPAPTTPAVDPNAAPAEAVKPPPGFSPTAKVVWNKDALSKEEWDAVKRDIAKRNDEVDRGFAKFAEYKPIERYMEMAKQSGTTLDRALENYIGIEQQLQRDFVSGISHLAQRQNVHPVALANAILARHGAAPSEGQAGGQPSHQPAPVDPNAIAQQIRQELRAEQEAAEINRAIKEFGSDPKNTFFENVRVDMGRLIEAGYVETIQDAYDRACWANPEIRNLLIKQQSVAAPDPGAKVAAATQARAAAKSITGSPIPNASVKGPQSSIEDDIRAAFDAALV